MLFVSLDYFRSNTDLAFVENVHALRLSVHFNPYPSRLETAILSYFACVLTSNLTLFALPFFSGPALVQASQTTSERQVDAIPQLLEPHAGPEAGGAPAERAGATPGHAQNILAAAPPVRALGRE